MIGYLEYWGLADALFLRKRPPLNRFVHSSGRRVLAHLEQLLFRGGMRCMIKARSGEGSSYFLDTLYQNLPVDCFEVLSFDAKLVADPDQAIQQIFSYIDREKMSNQTATLPDFFSAYRDDLKDFSASSTRFVFLLDHLPPETFLNWSRKFDELIVGFSRCKIPASYCFVNDSQMTIKPKSMAVHPINNRSFELGSWTLEDAESYVAFELRRAKLPEDLFDKELIAEVFKITGGRIKDMVDALESALVEGYLLKLKRIGLTCLNSAHSEP